MFQIERTYVPNLEKALNKFPFYGSIFINFASHGTRSIHDKNMGPNRTPPSLGRQPARATKGIDFQCPKTDFSQGIKISKRVISMNHILGGDRNIRVYKI